MPPGLIHLPVFRRKRVPLPPFAPTPSWRETSWALLKPGETLIRPTPANPILPNSNIVGGYDELKDGPSITMRFGVDDYRWLFEGLQSASPTNNVNYATANGPFSRPVKLTGNPQLIAPTGAPWNGEVCPDSIVWDPLNQRWNLYTNIGNNAPNQRFTRLYTGPSFNGPWTDQQTILSPGISGAWDDQQTPDFRAIRLDSGWWLGMYRGVQVATGRAQTGMCFSSDGVTWTKHPNNPVITPAMLGNPSGEAFGVHPWMDARNRLHCMVVSNSSVGGADQALYYGFSDDWGTTWKFNSTAILTGTGSASDPDFAIGDEIFAYPDGDLFIVTCMNFNVSFNGARLEGRGVYWAPNPVLPGIMPARPGRCLARVVTDRLGFPVAKTVLNSNTFSIYLEARLSPAASNRNLYEEEVQFDQYTLLWVDSVGALHCEYRTPTNLVSIISQMGRIDDGRWHRILFVRRGASDFEAYVDGASIGGSNLNGGTTASAPANCSIGNSDNLNSPQAILFGTIRRVETNSSYAFTPADDAALWNGGVDVGQSAPTTGTPQLRNLRVGDGGSEAANGITVTGTVLVDVTPPVQVGYAGPATTQMGAYQPYSRYSEVGRRTGPFAKYARQRRSTFDGPPPASTASISVPAGVVRVLALAPTLTPGGAQLQPASATLKLLAQAPALTPGAAQIAATSGVIRFIAQAPTFTNGAAISVPAGAVRVLAQVPTFTAIASIQAPSSILRLVGQSPVLTPGTGQLVPASARVRFLATPPSFTGGVPPTVIVDDRSRRWRGAVWGR